MTSSMGYAEVIGDPIAHSRSPLIHKHWLAELGLNFDYRATRVTRPELTTFVKERRADPLWRGCNVTMPLKLDALMLADGSSDRAVAAGAANLLLPKDGALMAGNTDVGAILRLLAELLAAKERPDGVTLLGNGGAARAVLVALRMLDIADVRIQARDLSAAYKLAVEFGLGQQPVRFDEPVTPAGSSTPRRWAWPGFRPSVSTSVPCRLMAGSSTWVTDPAETLLLKSAGERGLATIDGIALRVEQAADSFMLLYGRRAAAVMTTRSWRACGSLNRNDQIALTGSIGMGKSTVAAMFAEAGVPVFARTRRCDGAGLWRLLVEEIGQRFPGSVVDGAVNRERLAPTYRRPRPAGGAGDNRPSGGGGSS